MSPEEHYAEAVRLLDGAQCEDDPAWAAVRIAEAQVHATLATYAPPTVEIIDRVADWLDGHGDTWREVDGGELRVVAQKNGACHALGMTQPRDVVEKRWGPLVPAARAVTR